MSVMTILMTSSRSTTDPARLPAMPPPPRRTGTIYQRRPQPPLSAENYLDLLAWIWSYFVLAWNTLVDAALLAATMMFLSDPHTMFACVDGRRRHRRFVHRSLRLDDVNLIKTVMNCARN
jgi:hypothetical protein